MLEMRCVFVCELEELFQGGQAGMFLQQWFNIIMHDGWN